MIMNRNYCVYFQIMITLLLILLIIRLPFFVDAGEIINYPSSVNGPNSWRNTPSSDFSFFESAGVKPILVNGMFVCGFHCSFNGDNCLFSVSIFKTSSDGDSGISPQVVWSANRNNPIKVQAVLELTSDGQLLLKDANSTLVWSTGTVIGKSVSRLNLSPEGNLMLIDKTNRTVWQSFDHPTDSVVRAQRLLRGQKLRASVSPLDSSEGPYAFAIYSGQFNAYMDPDPLKTYYMGAYLTENYAEFQVGSFGSLSVADSANFIKFESDGYLKAYEWRESKWEGTDLLNIPPCDYPSACGTYGICSDAGCSCPDDVSENVTAYFRPINFTNPNLGCYAVTPLSCEPSLHHSFLELQEIYVGSFYGLFFPNITKLEDCKEACLKNCSCKAAIYSRDFSNMSYCYHLFQEFNMNKNGYVGYGSYFLYGSSAFIKVQNSPVSQTPNRDLSSSSFPERKKHNTSVIVGATLGAIFGVFIICTFILLIFKKGVQRC